MRFLYQKKKLHVKVTLETHLSNAQSESFKKLISFLNGGHRCLKILYNCVNGVAEKMHLYTLLTL